MLIFKEEILKSNYYLLWGGSFFSIKISCLRVSGLYFLTFSFIFAFIIVAFEYNKVNGSNSLNF